jgi:hypothetical protein
MTKPAANDRGTTNADGLTEAYATLRRNEVPKRRDPTAFAWLILRPWARCQHYADSLAGVPKPSIGARM